MKIVITGATGFIGRAAVVRLALQGHEITAVIRKKGSASDLPCKSIVCDLSKDDPSILCPVLRGADAVVHLAGESIAKSRWNAEIKQSIQASRVVGTRKLVEAMAALPVGDRPKLLISGSAIGFYGNRDDKQLTEDSPTGKGFLSEIVRAWEQEAIGAESLGVRVVQMRIGIVLGRGGGALEKIQPLILGSGRQWMSWIHLDDVVRFIEFAMSHANLRGAFNITAPSPVTNSEFTTCYAKATGSIVPFRVPAFVLKAAMGEMSVIVLEGCRALPQKAELSGFSFDYPNLSLALSEVFPTPLEFKLSESQFVARPISEVFAFFSEAKNLEILTPPWLKFHILRVSSAEMGNGTLIDYKLKIHGVPVRWQSKIENWQVEKCFVDFQTKGPYAKWYHTHSFKEVPGGTMVNDEVLYRLPGGKVGKFFGAPLVKRDVEQIFSYRRKKIAEVFS